MCYLRFFKQIFIGLVQIIHEYVLTLLFAAAVVAQRYVRLAARVIRTVALKFLRAANATSEGTADIKLLILVTVFMLLKAHLTIGAPLLLALLCARTPGKRLELLVSFSLA